MSARLVIALGAALAAAGAIAAAIALGLGGGSSEAEPRALDGSEPIAIAATLTPAAHRVGDPVLARLDVTVDERVVDSSLVEVRAQFAPYELAGDVETATSHRDGVTTLSFSYTIQCLTSACVSDEGALELELPPALVSYVRSDTSRGVDAPTSWPVAILVARSGSGGGPVPAEATLGALPQTTYAISPGLLRGLAIGLAALLIASVFAWLIVAVRPTWRPGTAPDEAPTELDPLGRALDELAAAKGGSIDAQRLALESLATQLELHNGTKLAPLARRLAWSSGAPDAGEIDALAAAARKLEEHA